MGGVGEGRHVGRWAATAPAGRPSLLVQALRALLVREPALERRQLGAERLDRGVAQRVEVRDRGAIHLEQVLAAIGFGGASGVKGHREDVPPAAKRQTSVRALCLLWVGLGNVTPHDGDPQAPLNIKMARKAAHEVREEARGLRVDAARARWLSRKQQLSSQRLRRRLVAERPPMLDDFVEVASVDELVEVLVLLAGRRS